MASLDMIYFLLGVICGFAIAMVWHIYAGVMTIVAHTPVQRPAKSKTETPLKPTFRSGVVNPKSPDQVEFERSEAELNVGNANQSVQEIIQRSIRK